MAFVLIAAQIHPKYLPAWEKSAFLYINHLPEWLRYGMQALQYLGVLLMPALVAVGFALRKRYATTPMLLAIIPLKLAVEHMVKLHVQRERPGAYIAETILRGDVQAHGLSFFSGHAFIVAAIATLLTPVVNVYWRIALWALVILCLVARIYLGAHLPLDVIAGALAGAACGVALLLTKSVIHYYLQK